MTGRIHDWEQDDDLQTMNEARESGDPLLRGWTNGHGDRLEFHLAALDAEDAGDEEADGDDADGEKPPKYALYFVPATDEAADAIDGAVGERTVLARGDTQGDFRGGGHNTAALEEFSPSHLGYPDEPEDGDAGDGVDAEDVRAALDAAVRDDDGKIVWDDIRAIADDTEGVPAAGISAKEMYERVVAARVEPGDG